MSIKSKLTYEKALGELQAIVEEMQEEVLGMDDLTSKAKRAAELVKFCREKLRESEEELKELFEE